MFKYMWPVIKRVVPYIPAVDSRQLGHLGFTVDSAEKTKDLCFMCSKRTDSIYVNDI